MVIRAQLIWQLLKVLAISCLLAVPGSKGSISPPLLLSLGQAYKLQPLSIRQAPISTDAPPEFSVVRKAAVSSPASRSLASDVVALSNDLAPHPPPQLQFSASPPSPPVIVPSPPRTIHSDSVASPLPVATPLNARDHLSPPPSLKLAEPPAPSHDSTTSHSPQPLNHSSPPLVASLPPPTTPSISVLPPQPHSSPPPLVSPLPPPTTPSISVPPPLPLSSPPPLVASRPPPTSPHILVSPPGHHSYPPPLVSPQQPPTTPSISVPPPPSQFSPPPLVSSLSPSTTPSISALPPPPPRSEPPPLVSPFPPPTTPSILVPPPLPHSSAPPLPRSSPPPLVSPFPPPTTPSILVPPPLPHSSPLPLPHSSPPPLVSPLPSPTTPRILVPPPLPLSSPPPLVSTPPPPPAHNISVVPPLSSGPPPPTAHSIFAPPPSFNFAKPLPAHPSHQSSSPTRSSEPPRASTSSHELSPPNPLQSPQESVSSHDLAPANPLQQPPGFSALSPHVQAPPPVISLTPHHLAPPAPILAAPPEHHPALPLPALPPEVAASPPPLARTVAPQASFIPPPSTPRKNPAAPPPNLTQSMSSPSPPPMTPLPSAPPQGSSLTPPLPALNPSPSLPSVEPPQASPVPPKAAASAPPPSLTLNPSHAPPLPPTPTNSSSSAPPPEPPQVPLKPIPASPPMQSSASPPTQSSASPPTLVSASPPPPFTLTPSAPPPLPTPHIDPPKASSIPPAVSPPPLPTPLVQPPKVSFTPPAASLPPRGSASPPDSVSRNVSPPPQPSSPPSPLPHNDSNLAPSSEPPHSLATPPLAMPSNVSAESPPPRLPIHAFAPPPKLVPSNVSVPPQASAAPPFPVPSQTVPPISQISAPPPSKPLVLPPPPRSAVFANGSHPPSSLMPPLASPPSPIKKPPHASSPFMAPEKSTRGTPPLKSSTPVPLAAPPRKDSPDAPAIQPIARGRAPSISPEPPKSETSSPTPGIDQRSDAPVAKPPSEVNPLSPSNLDPHYGSVAPSHSPSSRDNVSPSPSDDATMTPFHSPAMSPGNSTRNSDKPPMPLLALPPPPPNQDCSSLACTEPLTTSLPGSPCICVLPIQVGLRIGVALFTVFPLVPELAEELGVGTFMKQNQVRIMGAKAASEEPDETDLLVDLVPLGDKFDNITAFLVYQRFWGKEVSINKSLFGDYEVLFVRYPGLPAPPPAAPGSAMIGDGNGKLRPLGVNVPSLDHRKKLSGSLIAIIVISAVGALLLILAIGWVLLMRHHRRLVSQTASTPRESVPSLARTIGPPAQSLGSVPSSSLSFGSSAMVYTGSAKTFSASEIEKATDNFSPSGILGEGGFGRVHGGVLEDGTLVAVKVLKREDQHGGREFLAEIEMLSRLHHRNLVKLIGICVDERMRSLVYELIPNGSVDSHLHGPDRVKAPLDWGARMKIALGAARGLAYLHEDSSPRVIHRDFKSSNILLELDFTPKVSDFGLARTAWDEENRHISTRVMGTFGYVAPEYAMTGHLLVKSDVYSYGVVLLELLTGRKPVDMTQQPGQESLVAWARPFLSSPEGLQMIVDPVLLESDLASIDSISKVAAIASMCVQPEVSHRPFMGEVVQALKLVCTECDTVREEFGEEDNETTSRSCSNGNLSGEMADPFPGQYSGYSYGSAQMADDMEKGRLSVSDVNLGVANGGWGSKHFRRRSTSGPIKSSRSLRFWDRVRKLSNRDSARENGTMYRFWSGSQ